MPTSPPAPADDEAALDALCAKLRELSLSLEANDAWPRRQLELCAESGVFGWFFDPSWGGSGWSPRRILAGYRRLAAACLTTAFVLTQRMGACQRLHDGENAALRDELLPALIAGEAFATVGISHLTTSRRHLGQPALRALAVAGGYRLDGYSPWVTGALHADHVVIGAELEDGRQILAAAPMSLPGVTCAPFSRLMALTSSHTGEMHFRETHLDAKWVIAGPVENVMQRGSGAGTGGLATSALALGLADAAIGDLESSVPARPALSAAAEALRADWRELDAKLMSQVDDGETSPADPACSVQELRSLANGLVLRATHAALIAAKGAGYISGSPVGRWCREALFFLVWSCPAPVQAAHLCELAGLENESL